MKGLLTKDLILLRQQSKSLLIIVMCGIMMSIAFEKTAVIGYLGIIGTMLAVGTLSYDEFDNGFSFLFTLPFARKTFVREKYLLCIAIAAILILFGCAVSCIMMAAGSTGVDFNEIALSAGSMFFIALLFTSFLLPIRIKYGSEKGRTITYIFYAAILLLTFGGSKVLDMIGISIPAFVAKLDSMNPYVILGILCLVILALVIVSEKITERIIEKKEF